MRRQTDRQTGLVGRHSDSALLLLLMLLQLPTNRYSLPEQLQQLYAIPLCVRPPAPPACVKRCAQSLCRSVHNDAVLPASSSEDRRLTYTATSNLIISLSPMTKLPATVVYRSSPLCPLIIAALWIELF